MEIECRTKIKSVIGIRMRTDVQSDNAPGKQALRERGYVEVSAYVRISLKAWFFARIDRRDLTMVDQRKSPRSLQAFDR
ncbi:hypothetical protein EVAR_40656_1 [Eumeta japonica]|uniref:Uncharacterized protein n=1 Tax=Eumeta variegata TaxID=151549 RepID=A0A4C1X535_EUMVA|nr:hypothetical protein EVAR_40656_1 [Eumeta japonica]